MDYLHFIACAFFKKKIEIKYKCVTVLYIIVNTL